MASQPAFNFENFLPGFDFLKKFAQANPAAAMPAASQWVTPTLDPEELDKRIQELKSVQFWLDQNAKALNATIQAMEVQRMTLSTLKSMNVGMADVAAAMTGKAAPASGASKEANKGAAQEAAPAVDPMQWWGAISQQFQSIAAQAVDDMQKHAAQMQMPVSPKAATKTSSTKAPAAKKTARKTPARKSAR